jgi:hypothetical protein
VGGEEKDQVKVEKGNGEGDRKTIRRKAMKEEVEERQNKL